MALESHNYFVNNISQSNIDDAYFHTNIQNEFSRIQIANSIPFDSEMTIELKLEMKADGYLSQLFEIEKDFNNEIYDENLNPQNIEIKWIDAEDEEFAITQNTPNPWSFETVIDYYAPHNSDVNISVRDVNGKLILSNDVKAQKGWNTHRLKADDFKSSGIYIYEITSGKTTLSKRMILLNN